ncbi:MAG: ribosome biogenesis GTP-binding protein YihA/YsxC [candidate division NC10 bacterium]|nr:ribosome biogenesis GTP-binding protein YihA/YsxC [candidate division NC10 bacterium]
MRVASAAIVESAGRLDQFPRGERPEVAFAGRSNVGKSSLINRLLGRRGLARTSSTPGRTRTINFYLVNEAVLFADLPGYGYAKVSRSLQEDWWVLVEGYLTHRVPLRGVVHLVDARHPPTDRDQGLQDFLVAVGAPSVVVLTKADKVPRGQRWAVQATAARLLGLARPEMGLFFSAETGEGAPELWRAVDALLAAPPGRLRDRAGAPFPGPGVAPERPESD